MGRVLEGAVIVVIVIQIVTANAAGFLVKRGRVAGWWKG
jgi:hypothetical protein